MATSAQNASITFVAGTATYSLAEVADYTVDAVTNYTADHGEYGTVVVRSYANSIPKLQWGSYGMLTISHSGTEVFKAAAVVDRLRIEAQTNDVVRWATAFKLFYIDRS